MQGAKLLNIFIINKFLSVFYSPTMICLICLRFSIVTASTINAVWGRRIYRISTEPKTDGLDCSYDIAKKLIIRMIRCYID